MKWEKTPRLRRIRNLGAAVVSAGFMMGFLESCDDRMVTATRYLDPCGTVFANCEPGYFQIMAADPADWTLDPTCPIPGMCGAEDYQPLGTIYDLDP